MQSLNTCWKRQLSLQFIRETKHNKELENTLFKMPTCSKVVELHNVKYIYPKYEEVKGQRGDCHLAWQSGQSMSMENLGPECLTLVPYVSQYKCQMSSYNFWVPQMFQILSIPKTLTIIPNHRQGNHFCDYCISVW